MKINIQCHMLFFFLISFICLSQNDFNQNGERNGIWYDYHLNGSIKYEGEFMNGKEVGVFKYYDYAGNIAIKLNYLDRGVTSEAILYYQNGSIKSQGIYLNKKKHNTWSHYSNFGKKIFEENYLSGVLNGSVLYYDDNGLVSERYIYINGAKNGEATIFYSSGLVNLTCNYLNDTLNGKAKFYYNKKSIQLESEGQYHNGLKDSIWTFYNEIGDVIKIEKYHNGKLFD